MLRTGGSTPRGTARPSPLASVRSKRASDNSSLSFESKRASDNSSCMDVVHSYYSSAAPTQPTKAEGTSRAAHEVRPPPELLTPALYQVAVMRSPVLFSKLGCSRMPTTTAVLYCVVAGACSLCMAVAVQGVMAPCICAALDTIV